MEPFSSWKLALLLSILSLSLTKTTHAASCRFDGCDASRSFHLGDVDSSKSPFVLNETAYPGLQCSLAKQAALICTSKFGGPSESDVDAPTPGVAGLIALNLSGAIKWKTHQLYATTALPIIDINGNSFSVDGTVLVAYTLQGESLGQNVLIKPSMGTCFSMTATTNSVFVITSQASDIATYLTNGVPLAPLWLNTSLPNHAIVTYFAISTPVIAESRVYVLTALDAEHVPYRGLCRLYAFDVHRTLVGKIDIAWFWPTRCNATLFKSRSAAMMTLANDTVCTILSSDTHSDELACIRDMGSKPSVALQYNLTGSGVSLSRVSSVSQQLVVLTNTALLSVINLASQTIELEASLASVFNKSVVVHEQCPFMSYNRTDVAVPPSYVASFLGVATIGNASTVFSLSLDKQTEKLQLTVDWTEALPASFSECVAQPLMGSHGDIALVSPTALHTLSRTL